MPGMSISIHTTDAIDQWILQDSLRIVSVEFNADPDRITICLNARSTLEFPLNEFPVLEKASPIERANYIVIGDGIGVHWPLINEDLSLKGLLLSDMKRRIR